MIKTTKETHKQDETFKSKVTFDSYDNVYANVDGEMKSLSDYIDSKGGADGVTIATEQVITGQKHFKSGNYQITIGGSSVSKPTDTTALLIADSYGAFFEGGLHVKNIIDNNEANLYLLSTKVGGGIARGIYIKTSYGTGVYADTFLTMTTQYPTSRSTGITFYNTYMNFSNDNNKDTKVYYPYHVTSNTELATMLDLNATTALTLTNVSGHRYTGTISTSNKVECIVDIDGAYTANFNIAKGMKTAFLMVYGTSSTDVVTCFATMDSSGLVTIDLDNVSLSSFTPTCKYIIYN